MKTYIEREALLRALSKEVEYDDDGEQEINSDTVFITIEGFPAADVAQVVHGRWEQRKTPLGKTYSICSNCSTDFKFITDKGTLARLDMDGMPYCPNCGAKMDKEDET
jgi:DNA-directed RNA polymerase subunit RPC12/RpoP